MTSKEMTHDDWTAVLLDLIHKHPASYLEIGDDEGPPNDNSFQQLYEITDCRMTPDRIIRLTITKI